MSKKSLDIDYYKREIERLKAENASIADQVVAHHRAYQTEMQSLGEERQALLKEKEALLKEKQDLANIRDMMQKAIANQKELDRQDAIIADLNEKIATAKADLMNVLLNAKSARNKRK